MIPCDIDLITKSDLGSGCDPKDVKTYYISGLAAILLLLLMVLLLLALVCCLGLKLCKIKRYLVALIISYHV